MTSQPHTTCTHPSTSSARAACRKARAAAGDQVLTDVRDRIAADYAKKEAKPAAKKEKVAAANAKRTAASKKANPLKDRGECFECGSRAGWIDTRNNQPVCIKHVDYDHIRIINL